MAVTQNATSKNKVVASSAEKYLSFEINGEMYAVEILDVKEIIAMMKFTKVPKMPEFVKGVINLRGLVIPIIDIRSKFEIQELEYTERTTIIIGIVDTNLIGFIVDRTADVLNISESELSPSPKFGTAIDTTFLKSMAKTSNGVVMIVDLKKIFSESELNNVREIQTKQENFGEKI
nr:chemotaxis protein CheW [uncultured Sulfurimonas sp.]